ncbi:hypothetical protein VNI00_012985 [Paramarasmius palmivorus]|uniref:Uncharacterized protein n=1 Tax=Paramarasmius palmivorus TaxID=297713 RepID=A0AAW0BYR8_9AGAR
MVLFDDEGFVQSRFISCGPRPSEEKHVGWAVLDLILEHAHQIQCLCISSDDGPVESFFTSLMPHFWDRFINLEDLHIDVDSTSYSFIIAEEFNRSPLLHRIGIHSPAAGSPYVPTDHLTHIMLEEVELSNFANILTRCSLLESVDVKVYDARFHEDLSIPKCPRLRTFHVSFVGDDHYFDLDRFKDLVELLDFPSLTSLSLQMPRFDDNAYGNQRRSRVDEEYFSESLVDFVAAFEAFLTRSPNIESFRLVSSYLDDLDVYTLLTQLPKSPPWSSLIQIIRLCTAGYPQSRTAC